MPTKRSSRKRKGDEDDVRKEEPGDEGQEVTASPKRARRARTKPDDSNVEKQEVLEDQLGDNGQEVTKKAGRTRTRPDESNEEKEEVQRPQYFLMKAEPESRLVKGIEVKFSIEDLEVKRTSCWDGVRNHEAKNIMKEMRTGDIVLFYHSNCKTPGVAGICKVVKEAYPDHTAFDETHPYYHAKSDPKKPTWFMVDVEFVRKLGRFLPLRLLQKQAALKEMELIRRDT
ncbi:hypothetical protein HDU97_002573 [Phlyctochytrium planicorne]|nr:hypothetical protein HDU97_002573 [Phlyctochytrium planicorne]